MTLAQAVVALMWIGVTLYAVFGGADFGAGFWDLVAGGARAGAPQRRLIEHSIGPVWEANHVWLIFVLVVLWTGFPTAFAAIMTTLYVPLTAVAVGVILRGAGFAFRKAVPALPARRTFGALFAFSSVVTPFFLGTVAGAVASGRVPATPDEADPLDAWTTPTSLLGGTLAVATCTYLAATFLAADARRADNPALGRRFRLAGLAAAIVAGAIAISGIGVLRADAPTLYEGLTGPGLAARPDIGYGRYRFSRPARGPAVLPSSGGSHRRGRCGDVGLGGRAISRSPRRRADDRTRRR